MDNNIFLLYKSSTENRYTDDYSENIVAASYDSKKLMDLAKVQVKLHQFHVIDKNREKPENIQIDEFDDEIVFYGRVSKVSYFIDSVKII